jgi:hypothetical protein
VDEEEQAEPVRQQEKLLRIRGAVADAEKCKELLAGLEQSLRDRDEEEAMRLLGLLAPTFHRPGRDDDRVLAGASAAGVSS